MHDLLEKCIELNIGARLDNLNVSVVAYCDDIVLFSPVASHLRKLLKVCEEYAETWRINFNPSKSLIYCTDNKFLHKEKFSISNGLLTVVHNFIYLGLPIGDPKFVNSFCENNFRKVEKAFYCLKRTGLHAEFIDPTCLGFIYKQFCQSISLYGLEVLYVNKTTLKQFDTRQGILIKSALNLSKFSRTKPLMDALNIDSFNFLYFKFKVLFYDQIKNNYLTKAAYDNLKGFYQEFGTPRYSYFQQCRALETIIDKRLENTDGKEMISLLESKFNSSNAGLVDSLNFLLSNFDKFVNAKDLLRELLWVDFGT